MTKSVVRIMVAASIVFIIGIIIAYYNTATIGYDNANIFSMNKEGIRLFDINIKYTLIKEIIDFFKLFIPQRTITI